MSKHSLVWCDECNKRVMILDTIVRRYNLPLKKCMEHCGKMADDRRIIVPSRQHGRRHITGGTNSDEILTVSISTSISTLISEELNDGLTKEQLKVEKQKKKIEKWRRKMRSMEKR